VKEQDALEVSRLLGLDPTAPEFQVSYGAVARSNRELAIQTRSLFEIMIELSARVDPPDVHVASGYTSAVLTQAQRMGVPFRIQSGESKPLGTYAAVRYLDHWFWIPNSDEKTKIVLVFLMLLFSLVESKEGAVAPIVTIPTG
jgi:hypothetical protein